MNKNHYIDSRGYKYKNAHLEFFCPLCGTQRAVITNPHLSAKNYLQIFLITVAITACTYFIWELKGIFSFFLVWACFEASLRVNFRKEVPCPHCGFDASWYKKDVKVARTKVHEFWVQRGIDPNAKLEKIHTQQDMQGGEA
ncbi:hypothetical protein [Bacteriovorax sp. Seq25_V]|uniref:hypothetical protein n=1 Tax=Bacteriovorax sp. Seq25_V TaxID=1201288 RepID=UPI00038A12AD|nr:hypothetical protein [Bacteriovorax sp. Seq25_V]EQC45388.1 hypothetical protein M900_2296 [Bacteriovorax sp. Seq25_V]